MGLGDLTKKAQQGIDQAGQNIQDNVAPAVQEGVQTGIDKVGDTAPVVGEAIQTGAEKVGDVAEDVVDKAGDAVDDIKDTVKDATQNLNPFQKFNELLGKAKWIFWIVVVLAVLYGLMKLIIKIAWFKWVWRQLFSKDSKDKKKEVDNSELEKKARKENKIEIVKESPLVKSEYKSSKLVADYQSVAESKKAQKDAEVWDETLNDAYENVGNELKEKGNVEIKTEEIKEFKKEELKEPKKEPVNTSPKTFVEELKEKVQPGETNLKPSEFKKKGRKKKEN